MTPVTTATNLVVQPTKTIAVGDYLPSQGLVTSVTALPGGGVNVVAGGNEWCYSECSAAAQTTPDSTVIVCGEVQP